MFSINDSFVSILLFITMNNKTVIASISIVCVTFLVGLHIYVRRNIVSQQSDTFTNCLHVSMSESRQSGKVIDIKEAKTICDGLQKGK